jgi:hypothetical protein
MTDARRGSFKIVFGDGDTRWALGDPCHPIVVAAQHHVRYSKPLGEADTHALVLASIVSDMAYLVHACPTTKLACEKLAAMRAAVRRLGPVTEGPLRERGPWVLTGEGAILYHHRVRAKE